ncbi:hypothetical protein CE91St43_14270 [Oscillospiraceae bacterium]|nr:hypothetical protein CE91St43_14270 [Oscillospiraceae bacterium]
MYKSDGRARGQTRRRRRARRRTGLFLAGALAMGLLLMGAGRALETLAIVPDETIAQPQAVTQVPSAELPPPVEKTDTAAGDWRLTLVNPWNPLPDGYEVPLTQLKNGSYVDERSYPDLQAMMDACRAEGLSPVICSAYRSQEKQEALYANQLDKQLALGLSEADARAEAGKVVAVPGTSEHQLGLAVDLVDLDNQNLNESQEKTAVQKWLLENSWKYGFVLRYPNDKRELTGIIYEPWHYRYVGKDAAQEIYETGVCLEEYLKGRDG